VTKGPRRIGAFRCEKASRHYFCPSRTFVRWLDYFEESKHYGPGSESRGYFSRGGTAEDESSRDFGRDRQEKGQERIRKDKEEAAKARAEAARGAGRLVGSGRRSRGESRWWWVREVKADQALHA
jgi:hypothetical protein